MITLSSLPTPNTNTQNSKIELLNEYANIAGFKTKWLNKNSIKIKSKSFTTEKEAKDNAAALKIQFINNKKDEFTTESDLDKHIWTVHNKKTDGYQIIVNRIVFQLPIRIKNNLSVSSELKKIRDYCTKANIKITWTGILLTEILLNYYHSKEKAEKDADILVSKIFSAISKNENIKHKKIKRMDIEKYISVRYNSGNYSISVDRSLFLFLNLINQTDINKYEASFESYNKIEPLLTNIQIPSDQDDLTEEIEKKISSYSNQAKLDTTWLVWYNAWRTSDKEYDSKETATEDANKLISVIFDDAYSIDQTIERKDIEKYIEIKHKCYHSEYKIFIDISLFIFLKKLFGNKYRGAI